MSTLARDPSRAVVLPDQPAHYGCKRSPGAEAQIMPGANAGIFRPEPWCLQAGGTTIGALFAARTRIDASAVAVVEGNRRADLRRAERAREPPRARAGERGHSTRRSGRHSRPQLRRLARAGAGRRQARRHRRGAELAARAAGAAALHPPCRAPRHAGRRGLRRDARRSGRGGAAHDHARRRLRDDAWRAPIPANRRPSPSRRILW